MSEWDCGGLSGEYTSQPVAVPQNHKRALCDLTVADRLALYDHVTGELNQQRQEATANEDLYVDLVAKLKRGRSSWEPYRLLQDARRCYYPDMLTASGLKKCFNVPLNARLDFFCPIIPKNDEKKISLSRNLNGILTMITTTSLWTAVTLFLFLPLGAVLQTSSRESPSPTWS